VEAKIIYLPGKKEKPLLTRLMIVTLIEAYTRQSRGIPFGPVDIRGGSFTGLIERELVAYKSLTIRNDTQSLWQVTQKGIDILRMMGIDVDY
jgi:hypothetical protein